MNLVYHNQTVFIKEMLIGENIHILSRIFEKAIYKYIKAYFFAIDFGKKPLAQKIFTLKNNLKKL